MSASPKYYIKGNLSEKQIEADVAAFFGWCTPQDETAFRLLDINEQKTGADKLYDRATAIYMQFKKSAGLKSTHDVAISTRKRKSPLEGIRKFRNEYQLDQDPTLFFQLHPKAKNASDLQHNVLLGYERQPWSRAIYVAPLLLDKDSYHQALFRSTDRFLLDPFYYRIGHSIQQRYWTSYFGSTPFLREHISIPPHERVLDHNHYYAYSETGTDISWHSPSIVERDASRLSDFFVKLISTAVNEPDSMLSLEVLSAKITEISSNLGFQADKTSNSPLAILGEHGRWLRDKYGIRQFILLSNAEFLEKLRND